MMRRAVVAAAVAGALVVGAGALPAAGGGSGHGDEPGHGGHGSGAGGHLDGWDVVALRQATRPFRDIEATLASGRVDLDLCFDQMGEHYADPATFGDGILDPLDPEAMVYEHTRRGLRLVAVEWVSTDPGEVLGIPLQLNESLGVWVLHAWIARHNPDGLLADFNPRVGDCP